MVVIAVTIISAAMRCQCLIPRIQGACSLTSADFIALYTYTHSTTARSRRSGLQSNSPAIVLVLTPLGGCTLIANVAGMVPKLGSAALVDVLHASPTCLVVDVRIQGSRAAKPYCVALSALRKRGATRALVPQVHNYSSLHIDRRDRVVPSVPAFPANILQVIRPSLIQKSITLRYATNSTHIQPWGLVP